MRTPLRKGGPASGAGPKAPVAPRPRSARGPYLCLVLLLAGAGLAGAQHGHPAAGPPGKLAVGVGSPTAGSGQELDIPVTLAGATNLGALELVLTYDPAVLEAKSADRGTLLSSNSLLEYYANPSGRLAVTLVSQDGVTGDGPVVKARFLVKGQPGQKSALRLENVRAWDGKTHLDFLVTTASGEFTVDGGWPWWILAVVAAGVAVLLILLGCVGGAVPSERRLEAVP